MIRLSIASLLGALLLASAAVGRKHERAWSTPAGELVGLYLCTRAPTPRVVKLGGAANLSTVGRRTDGGLVRDELSRDGSPRMYSELCEHALRMTTRGMDRDPE